MKKLLSIILSVTLLISMTTAAFAEETEEKILRIAVDASFKPFEYHENGILTGFDIELMNHLAGELGYKTEYFECPFDVVFLSVMSGQSDCAISAITITEERKKELYYTEPYIYSEADGTREYFGIPTNDPELRDALNNQLAIAKASGIVDNLIIKYLSDEKTDYFTAYTNIEDHSSKAASGSPSDWAKESIGIGYAARILEGDDYQFSNPITREEFCEMIYNLILAIKKEISAIHPQNFTDTDNRKMLVLSGLGIINGKSETTLAPKDFLTREEAATIIIRMVNKVVPMPTTEKWFEYEDMNEISDWASDAVQTISNLGFMNGVGENKFAPQDTYTTEQAVVTLVRVLKSAGEAGLLDGDISLGIIGGADGPTSIIVGENTYVIGENALNTPKVTATVKIDDFYIKEALRLITESSKLASDKNFIGMYTANDEMTEKILALGTVDFNNPKNIFRLSADREQIIANIEKMAEAEDISLEKKGDAWLEHIWRKLNFSTLASLINSSYGTENLAALTMLVNNRGYIMPKDFKDDFALYLQYPGDYSAIVSFYEYGDGVISAHMSFVKNGVKDNIFSRIYEITSTLGENSIKFEKVER